MIYKLTNLLPQASLCKLRKILRLLQAKEKKAKVVLPICVWQARQWLVAEEKELLWQLVLILRLVKLQNSLTKQSTQINYKKNCKNSAKLFFSLRLEQSVFFSQCTFSLDHKKILLS